MGESVLKSQIPSPALFESIVQTVSDYAIFAVDPHGTVLTWNRGAQRINGYSPDEIIGHSFEVFYPKELRDAQFPRYELEVASRDGQFENEGWRVRKDGSQFWARAVLTALRDEAGQVIGYA